MPGTPALRWPRQADHDLCAAVHRLVHDVSALGGAIGWLEPPPAAATDAWLRGVLAELRVGDAALCLAEVDGTFQAMACWRRDRGEVMRHCALVSKVMVHPVSRGRGLGHLVTRAVVEDARRAGIETLHLGVRGNNHGAISLYEHLGFRVWGRLPGAISHGELRFDDVRLYLQFPFPAGTRVVGSLPEGPGASGGPG